MIRNYFEDEVDVKGRRQGGHDAHDNDRGLCRDQTVLMGHVGDEKRRDGESLDRLAVSRVVDAVVNCRLRWPSGFVVMPLSDLLRPLFQARSKLTVSKSAKLVASVYLFRGRTVLAGKVEEGILALGTGRWWWCLGRHLGWALGKHGEDWRGWLDAARSVSDTKRVCV